MVKQIQTIEELNAFFRQDTQHPYVSVGHLEWADLNLFEPIEFGLYCVVLVDSEFGTLTRDGKPVTYEAGSLFSIRPGQVVGMNLDAATRPNGLMLAFRPELLVKAGLGRDFYMFNFFSCDTSEALALSPMERTTILNAFDTLIAELQNPADHLTDHMIRLCIGHLLSFFKRFHDRRFVSERQINSDLVIRLNSLLDEYLSSGQPIQKGQPTVAWCAEQFHLSPNYFGDLIKRELQITAQEYIQEKIITTAKSMLKDSNLSVTDIAKSLGFSYPNHFTRLFHKKTGISPTDFRKKRM